jgi:radical SAM-linked protein
MDVWEAAFAAEGVEPARYLGTIPVTARLPWDHIDVGLEEGFLLREYRKAVKNRLSLPCGKVAGAFVHATNLADAQAETKRLVCYDCGVACDLSAMREQRLVYLRKLGAEVPREPAPPPRARAQKGPPPRIVQGEARRYRFVFEKLGPAAFLSHLDLIRALPRAFRRLGLPLFYSSGFHPKPDMTFGPALSLGVASLGECVDVKIADDVEVASRLDELTEGAHAGLRFIGAVKLGLQDAAVSRLVDRARYVVGIPRVVVGERGGDAWVQACIEKALGALELPVVRRIDGIGKRVDVRDFVCELRVGHDADRELLARAGVVGDLVTVATEVEVRGSGGVKIAEVIEATFGDAELPHRAVRTALGASGGDGTVLSPLELDAIRALRTGRAAAPVDAAPVDAAAAEAEAETPAAP